MEIASDEDGGDGYDCYDGNDKAIMVMTRL